MGAKVGRHIAVKPRTAFSLTTPFITTSLFKAGLARAEMLESCAPPPACIR